MLMKFGSRKLIVFILTILFYFLYQVCVFVNLKERIFVANYEIFVGMLIHFVAILIMTLFKTFNNSIENIVFKLYWFIKVADI